MAERPPMKLAVIEPGQISRGTLSSGKTISGEIAYQKSGGQYSAFQDPRGGMTTEYLDRRPYLVQTLKLEHPREAGQRVTTLTPYSWS